MHIRATIHPELLTCYIKPSRPGIAFLGPEMHLSLGHVVVPMTEMEQEGDEMVGIRDFIRLSPFVTFTLTGKVDRAVFSEGSQAHEYPTDPPPSNWHLMLDMFAHSFLLARTDPLRPFSSHLPSAWLLAGHMLRQTHNRQFAGLAADYGWTRLFMLPPSEAALQLTRWALEAAEIAVPPPARFG